MFGRNSRVWMTWVGAVANLYDIHIRKMWIDNKTLAYIELIILKKTLKAFSFKCRLKIMLNKYTVAET